MSDQADEMPPVGETNKVLIRPDPLFKDVTRRAARAAGLTLLDIELPQLLRADLVLSVPQGKDLSNTLFEFLSPYSILEFKSENDTFDRSELDRNLARSLLFLSENSQVAYSQLLTVFVCAERPKRVIKHLNSEGMAVERDSKKPWLLRTQFGPLKIVIVVCRLLPLEKRFYEWLLFAPVSSQKWREFVTMLRRTGEKALIEQVRSLHLKEYILMNPVIMEMLQDLSPEELEEYNNDLVTLINMEMETVEKYNPKKVVDLMLEQLAKLSPANLSSEQRQKILALLIQLGQLPAEDNQKPN